MEVSLLCPPWEQYNCRVVECKPWGEMGVHPKGDKWRMKGLSLNPTELAQKFHSAENRENCGFVVKKAFKTR